MHLFIKDFLAEGLANTFGYLDKFCAPYPTMPIFSDGHDFGYSGPFGQPAIIRSLMETNCMKLASLSNPSGNLYLIVCNLETSHYKFTIFTLSSFKLFSVWSTLVYFSLFFVGFHITLRFPTSNKSVTKNKELCVEKDNSTLISSRRNKNNAQPMNLAISA